MARQARKLTPASLRNAALHHLERFATSTANLRRVLLRKLERAARVHPDTDREAAARWIEDLLADLARQGLLDDRLYAEGRVTALRRRGDSSRSVRGKLRRKGLDENLIETLLDGEGETSEVRAAAALARRRRLGPWRTPALREEAREKDLATLARAGFSYDVARRVVDAETPEELENADP